MTPLDFILADAAIEKAVSLGFAIDESTPFLGLPLDSLEFVELQLSLENAFGIVIPDADIAAVLTIGDLVAVVNRLRLVNAAT